MRYDKNRRNHKPHANHGAPKRAADSEGDVAVLKDTLARTSDALTTRQHELEAEQYANTALSRKVIALKDELRAAYDSQRATLSNGRLQGVIVTCGIFAAGKLIQYLA